MLLLTNQEQRVIAQGTGETDREKERQRETERERKRDRVTLTWGDWGEHEEEASSSTHINVH